VLLLLVRLLLLAAWLWVESSLCTRLLLLLRVGHCVARPLQQC
jgi:hypothetical protein